MLISKSSKRFIAAIAAILGSFSGWLLFAASMSAHELMLGSACAAVATLMGLMAWTRMAPQFHPSMKQLAAAWRLPWYVVSGCWEMLVILLKDSSGAKRPGSFYRATLFAPRPGNDAQAAAVLATAYTTVAPNFIVIGISQRHLLFHQIERSSVPRMIRDLEGRR